MQTRRLLLPFTHCIDTNALENALRLAKGYDATLISLALIRVPEGRKGARLEHIQQAKDFLEAVKCKAARYDVPVERLEVFTSDVALSIDTVALQMECEGVLVFVRGEVGVLLQADDIKRLLEMKTHKIYLMRMPSGGRKNVIQLLRQGIAHWLPGSREQQVSPMDARSDREYEPGQSVEAAEQLVGSERTR